MAKIRTNLARKPSYLAEHGIKHIDYKDIKLLQRFIAPNGRILPRRLTRLTRQEQRVMTLAIKRARHIALLPFVQDAEIY
ncbi:MAG: 30S ribosomal protein S18 [Calditrichaeota bacterium]|nr:30S ribosomal protein S18 [Calditrichota bacterium]